MISYYYHYYQRNIRTIIITTTFFIYARTCPAREDFRRGVTTSWHDIPTRNRLQWCAHTQLHGHIILRHHSPTGWSRTHSSTHTLANRYTRRRDNGEKNTIFFFSLFAMCVRACIDAFYHFSHPPRPRNPRCRSLRVSGTNIVIYTSGKPGDANNGMNVSSPRGGKCKNVSFYPRRVESKFGRVVFSAKKKSMGTCGKSHYYGGWEKNKNNRTKK